MATNVNDAPIPKESTDFQLLANNASKNVPSIEKKTIKKYVKIHHVKSYESSSDLTYVLFDRLMVNYYVGCALCPTNEL